MKPFLKWAGGKRQLLPRLRAALPGDFAARRYCEPFLGAGALLFALEPRRAFVNDVNGGLIGCYRALRSDCGALIALLENHATASCESYYYYLRDLDRDEAAFAALTETEKAARLIYLNRTCYNGLYRVNAKGQFNVPWGFCKNPAVCNGALLREISGYLNRADIVFSSADFSAAARGMGRSDFIYFDPPYHSEKSTNFTAYAAGGFSAEDQVRLRDTVLSLTESGAKCLDSNADTAFIRGLYGAPCFTIQSAEARRPINSDARGRGPAGEVIIRNWP